MPQFLNRTLRQVHQGHQTQLLRQEGFLIPLPLLDTENINLVNPYFKITKELKSSGKSKESWIVWLMSMIPALGIWRKEDQEFKVPP